VSLGYQASPSGVLSFSYWIDNLGFITEGKTCCYIHQTFSWGSQLAGYFTSSTNAIKLSSIIITVPSTSFSGTVAGEKEDFCKGSFTRTSFTLF
jgi:hypothetical protein